MNAGIRLPFITADTTEGKLAQVQSYMYQLVEQLNFALKDVERQQEEFVETQKTASSGKITQEEASNTFESIKALIIKSADIVNAYYDEISLKLEGLYVAQSDFGEYQETTNASITANSVSISQLYENLQTVIDTLSATTAYIRSGLLSEEGGVPIYGVEVGQRTVIDGSEVFNKYARFTADGIYFYSPNDQSNALSWMTGQRLYIRMAEILNDLKLGGFDLDLSNGIVGKWIGG